jgi:copper transport protein
VGFVARGTSSRRASLACAHRLRAVVRLGRVALALLAGVSFVPVVAAPAQAHSTLITTVPQAGYAVAEAPRQVVLVFDEAVTLAPRPIVVRGQARGLLPVGPPEQSADGRTVTVDVKRVLPEGRYTVRWEVVGEDGHVVEGAFGFGVGASASAAAASTSTPGLPAAAALRWLVFTGLALALGGIVGDRLVVRRITRANPSLVRPRPYVVSGCALGAVGTLGIAVHQLRARQPARRPRGFPAGAAGGLTCRRAARGGDRGIRRRGGRRGHPAASGHRGRAARRAGRRERNRSPAGQGRRVGALLTGVHLLAAAGWVGALVHLVRAALRWRGAPRDVRAVFAAYAMLAAVLYGLVVATGTVAAILTPPYRRRFGHDRLWPNPARQTGPGRPVSGLALAARRRVGRPGRTPPGALPTGPFVRAERAALVGVLAVTAVLASMATPVDPDAPLPYSRRSGSRPCVWAPWPAR